MDWIQLVGAVGAGAIATKLLDILWLHRLAIDQERLRWLRDRRLGAFAALAKDLITLGLTRKEPENFVHGYIAATEALLLVEDDTLADRIDQFIVRVDRFYELDRNGGAGRVQAEQLYGELQREARAILNVLRASLVRPSHVRPSLNGQNMRGGLFRLFIVASGFWVLYWTVVWPWQLVVQNRAERIRLGLDIGDSLTFRQLYAEALRPDVLPFTVAILIGGPLAALGVAASLYAITRWIWRGFSRTRTTGSS